MSDVKSEFGVFGLGVMGSSLSLNIADKGYELSVFNRAEGDEEHVVDDFMKSNSHLDNIHGFTDLDAFIESMAKPRKILLMIKAGPTIDLVLNNLVPRLSKGDVIIDGGNSHYLNTKKRFDFCQEMGIEFIGAGISGGEEGARKGPSIMPGGKKESYSIVSSVLESISAKDDFGKTCCAYIGPEGAGHFIKMVHNGVEYVEMQLLAELYAIMSISYSNEKIAEVFESWDQGELSSYLLGITTQILRKKEGENYLLDKILDKAGNKGTGSWSSKAAFDLGIPNTMMSSAVFARYISSFKERRIEMSGLIKLESITVELPDLDLLKGAYKMARLLNHQQGFKLMELASESFDWELDFSSITRIWSNGCIIKSHLMNKLYEGFKAERDLFKMDFITAVMFEDEKALREVLKYGLDSRISLHCFTAGYQYWVDMTTERLPANLIQAQRDFFGAHTYQRTDDTSGEFFHTKW